MEYNPLSEIWAVVEYQIVNGHRLSLSFQIPSTLSDKLAFSIPARGAFIVNALSLGITPNIVMKRTGHSDYKAMKPYINIVDSIKAGSMTKFDGLL